MYAKPNVRPLDAATAVSSCVPCTARTPTDDPTYLEVSPAYSQVGNQGFCYPGLPLEFSVRLSVRDSGAEILDLVW